MAFYKQSQDLIKKIFSLSSHREFNDVALEIFLFQYKYNKTYHFFCRELGVDALSVQDINDIPFLPIEVFKNHIIKTGDLETEAVFFSSGTTSSIRSKHYITDIELYRRSLLANFRYFLGSPKKYCIFALLPGYSENNESSLVFMVKTLMENSQTVHGGFFKDDFDLLVRSICNCPKQKKVILFGVTHALLKLARDLPRHLENTIIIETGGMKGTGKEITREEVHSILKSNLKTSNIYSEYGMTELLSQAYSLENGIFRVPPTMKVMIRDLYDPLEYLQKNETGAINVIDLSNIFSCSFIATMDIGKIHKKNDGFYVSGRMDYSDIRGCNLLEL